MTLLILLAFVFFTFSFAGYTTLKDKHIYYKRVYKTLQNKTFYKGFTTIRTNENEKTKEVAFFLDTKTILLGDRIFLHNAPITYIDPYSCYWMFKYRRFFKKIDITKLEDYSILPNRNKIFQDNNCLHKNTKMTVLESFFICKKTAIQCTVCNKIISTPVLDC